MQNSEKYKNEIARLLNEKTKPKPTQKSSVKQNSVFGMFGDMNFHNCTVTLIQTDDLKKSSED